MSQDQSTFRGEIKVASRIIDYLSSGLYPSPGACLKELVNNSYDADASIVAVYVKPDADRIIIEDDGIGMTRDEFVTHFERVSESHKREKSELTPSGRRPKIGKIGIGFIAANEICEVMEVYSTKKGNSELLHVTINFEEMRKPAEERRRTGGDFVKADYFGEILETTKADHYTRIFLTGVRGEAQNILAGARPQSASARSRSLYGMSSASVQNALADPTLKSWKDFDSYSETMLEVALNVPVRYHESWLPNPLQRKLRDIESAVETLGFEVYYDGTELRKPVVFSPGERGALINRFEFKGKHVAAQGYFYAQHGTIQPRDLHGLLVRIRNAAVGEFDDSFWGFSPSESSLIQRWVSAEIWADDRLEEAMNIDRRTLREAHPAYVELRDAVHKHLRAVLSQARSQLYQSANVERRDQRASVAITDVTNVVRTKVTQAARAESFEKNWEKAVEQPRMRRALLKKFTVAELYEAVIESAQGVVTEEQLTEILRRLTARLGA
ncbi:MAG TPA: ATP-binding protein [Longimicrobium sp.]|jgi:hypothetical protein|uniref:ATP-binding protein n=1 Tax=Longimicrobium sp. TaxID=2029185 RepID=UPI002ED9F075